MPNSILARPKVESEFVWQCIKTKNSSGMSLVILLKKRVMYKDEAVE